MKNLLILILSFTFSSLFAQDENADKSLSPYFLVKNATSNVDALPLKSTTADVKIAGMIADVIMQYTEMSVPTEGVYQFVYPTVVGPRYNSQQQSENTNEFAAIPYLKKGEATPYTFDIQVTLNSGVPIQNIHSKTHWIDVKQSDNYHVVAQLKKEDGGRGNKDFILNYQLKGEYFQSGVMLYEHNNENFFMAMIQPPKAVSNDQIPPREYIFIVDVSGSMGGFPLDVSIPKWCD